MYQVDEMGFYCLGIAILWWVVASAFLYFAWNRVVASITKLKIVNYWQALLVVATVMVFCAPSHMARRYSMGHMCGSGCGSVNKDSAQKDADRAEMMDDMIDGEEGEVVIPEAP